MKFTRQEYFLLEGIGLAASFFPKHSMDELFSKSSTMRQSEFMCFPNFTKYMPYSRFKQLMKHLTFANVTSREGNGGFWQIQPLIDSFNAIRARMVSPGYKLVGDESMSPWRGKDERFGVRGCPHVTKIIRKPKGVGMEVKNLACCDSGILMALEIMAGKLEMQEREYVREYGGGTSLLLRLSANWHGTGRLIVADSAFASVKSAVALKSRGLYFMGLVKTAHRKFPKKWAQTVEIASRGGHKVVQATEEGVKLRAVTWNDGKKDKKTGDIIRKCIISSCGTTLPSTAHRKRRWRVVNGLDEDYQVSVPRPNIVSEYFDGAAKIDIHNHFRQGPKGVCLESRRSNRWEIRFWQTWRGFLIVDAFKAYTRFCPGKSACKLSHFVRVVAQALLDNTIGCAPDAPALRRREPEAGSAPKVHRLVQNKKSSYFIGKIATAVAANKPTPQCVLRCRICGKNSSYHCSVCSFDDSRTRGMCALCGPKSGRDCFEQHQMVTPAEDVSTDV